MDIRDDQRRFHALDGLRGWAAVSVIFYHTILNYNPLLVQTAIAPPASVLGFSALLSKITLTVFNGEYAVTVFFILSGFVLERSLQKSQKVDAPVALRFCIRRLFRIMPALMASVALLYLIARIRSATGGPPAPASLEYWKNAFLIDTQVHGVTWTIRLEMLAVPAVLAYSLMSRSFGIVGAVLAVLYSLVALQIPTLTLSVFMLHTALLPFSIGMLIAQPGARQAFEKVGTGTAIGCLLIFLFWRFFVIHEMLLPLVAQTMLGGVVVGVLAYSNNNALTRFFERPFSQLIGRISYSLYLFSPATAPLMAWVVSWFLTPSASQPLPSGFALGLGILLISIPLACITERYIERPGVAAGSWLTAQLKRGRSAAQEDAAPVQP